MAKKWMAQAFKNAHGQLRSTAARKGLIKGGEALTTSDLNALEKVGGKTAKRAQLAETAMKANRKRRKG